MAMVQWLGVVECLGAKVCQRLPGLRQTSIFLLPYSTYILEFRMHGVFVEYGVR